MRISFIFPVCSGASKLARSVSAVKKELSKAGSYEIIIVENGSTDGSYEVAESLCSRNVNVLHFPKRLGKGLAIKKGMEKARGKIIMFSDVDLSIKVSAARDFMRCIEKGSDLCIGSRYISGSSNRRFFKRNFLSAAYIILARTMFGSRATDFQCGFKAFSRKALPIALSARNNSWFWDTEVIISSGKKGLRISEVPVCCEDFGDSSSGTMEIAAGLFYDLIKYRISTLLGN